MYDSTRGSAAQRPSNVDGGGLNDGGVAQLVAMGFSRDQASYALLKAGGDVEAAASILSNQ